MSTASTANNKKDSSTPFTNVLLLMRIADFVVKDVAELSPLLRLNSSSYDALVNFSAEMWKRLSLARWPKGKLGSFCFYTFMRRHVATQRSKLPAEEVNDIEGCTGVQFRFRCPLIASNLRVLDEVRPGSNDAVLFCDVCEKKVYTVSEPNRELIKKVAAGEPGSGERRCVYIPAETAKILKNISLENDGTERKSKLWQEQFHIAVLTTEPASSSPQQQTTNHLNAAQQFVHQLYSIWRDDESSTINNPPERMFLSADALRAAFCFDSYMVNVRIVHVNRAAAAAFHDGKSKQNPLEFLNKEMRPAFGWQAICCVDELTQRFISSGVAKVSAGLAGAVWFGAPCEKGKTADKMLADKMLADVVSFVEERVEDEGMMGDEEPTPDTDDDDE